MQPVTAVLGGNDVVNWYLESVTRADRKAQRSDSHTVPCLTRRTGCSSLTTLARSTTMKCSAFTLDSSQNRTPDPDWEICQTVRVRGENPSLGYFVSFSRVCVWGHGRQGGWGWQEGEGYSNRRTGRVKDTAINRYSNQ